MSVSGKTVLITGATDGVGRLVAERLATQGAQVLLHGRSAEKGERVMREIRAAAPDARLDFFRADLASLDEVRGLADAVAARHRRLDVLVNNAGIGFGAPGTGRELSRDGHELRFAVNYLSHFLLTLKLLPIILASAPARIVNVSSIGQYPLDFANLMMERDYEGTRAYRQSKLAQIMFTIDLAEMLGDRGVTVNCLHPATLMNTNMVTQAGMPPRNTVETGAEAVLRLAVSPDVAEKTGLYFDVQREAEPNPQALDPAVRRRLWELSLRLVGLAEPLVPVAA